MDKNIPEWYWKRGLHDARIVSVTKKESSWNPIDTQLILIIDCDGVIGEGDITQIKFKQIRIKPNDFDINLLNQGWWLSDELTFKGDHYSLELKFDTQKCKTKRVELLFENAEVTRT